MFEPDFPDFDLGYYYRVPYADVVVWNPGGTETSGC
jgi:hypothetical protein